MGQGADAKPVFVVYRHEVFARGIQGFLEDASDLRIVGMETDPGKAIEAARCLNAEVIVVEESHQGESPLQAFFEIPSVRRIVRLSLEHEMAQVYDARVLTASGASSVAAAIRGAS